MTQDLGPLARQRFADLLAQTGIFQAVVPGGGDAEFQLAVVRSLGAAFSGGWRPLVTVRATLRLPDGTVVWEGADWTKLDDRVLTRSFFPASALWHLAAGIAVENLVRVMRGAGAP